MDAADQSGPGRVISVTGVPTSADAHHAGQDLAPVALRERRLLDRLKAGPTITDVGDVAGEVVAAASRLAEETG